MAGDCPECHGTGIVWAAGCTCGSGLSPYYPHEHYCGAEPCPLGCAVSGADQ